MDDITIPNQGEKPETEFVVRQIPSGSPSVHRDESSRRESEEPKTHIKVRFDKFIQLVATHDFEQVISRFAEEEVVLSSNLLTELASAHESSQEESGNKMPVVFVVGLVLGIVVTYLLVSQ